MVHREGLRRWSGLFLELIFVVFLLGIGPKPVVVNDEDNRETFSASSTEVVEPLCRTSHEISTDGSFCLKHLMSGFDLGASFVDLSAVRVLNAKAFFLSSFERNVFYALASIHAP
jgi:hypothetical protein